MKPITTLDLPAYFRRTFEDPAVLSLVANLRAFDPFGSIVGPGFAVVTRDAAFGPFESEDAAQGFIESQGDPEPPSLVLSER